MPQSTKYILPLYGVLAVYTLGYFSYRNGYISTVVEKRSEWLASPPGDPKRRPKTTGIESLDETLAAMFVFYWPALDGTSPTLSLVFCSYFGAIVLSLVLFTMESLRKGNRNSFSFFYSPTFWGLFSIAVTLAISIPWYLVIHLFISTTASRPTIDNMSIPIHELRALLVNVVFGLILPCVVVVLPETITETLFTRQSAISLWQLWPFWSTTVHFVAKWFIPNIEHTLDQKTRWEKTRTAFRYVYGFTFALAAISHIATWTISLTAAYVLPHLMDADTVSALHPAAVFLNTSPWSPITTDSVAEGTLWLIQWDKALAVGAIYWWSLDLYRATHATHGKKIDWFSVALKTVGFCLISGFTGAAIELLWEREEIVMEAGRVKEKSK